MKIWTVDAFTTKPYSGNPAAVAIVDEFLSDETCFQIATEMNLSETVFIKPLTDNEFHIRWFKPAVEVKLCGHGTLAAAHILYQEGLVSNDPLSFKSLSGLLRVYRSDNKITLDFPLQKTGPQLEASSFQNILNIPIIAAEIASDDIIVETSMEALLAFQANSDKISSLDCRGLILTAKDDTCPYDFISRFFAPRSGFLEDPVTGSAHCKLADYWQKKLGKTEFIAYQASKRGGELILNIQRDRVHISGHAVTVMTGEWQIK